MNCPHCKSPYHCDPGCILRPLETDRLNIQALLDEASETPLISETLSKIQDSARLKVEFDKNVKLLKAINWFHVELNPIGIKLDDEPKFPAEPRFSGFPEIKMAAVKDFHDLMRNPLLDDLKMRKVPYEFVDECSYFFGLTVPVNQIDNLFKPAVAQWYMDGKPLNLEKVTDMKICPHCLTATNHVCPADPDVIAAKAVEAALEVDRAEFEEKAAADDAPSLQHYASMFRLGDRVRRNGDCFRLGNMPFQDGKDIYVNLMPDVVPLSRDDELMIVTAKAEEILPYNGAVALQWTIRLIKAAQSNYGWTIHDNLHVNLKGGWE